MYTYIKNDAIVKKTKRDHNRSFDKSTGIPVDMKQYIENQTGLSYDDVRIHYNSNKPSKFEALGYTQGNDIFLQQGQEKHLLHELCHVAQQKKGFVKPTSFIGEYAVNDNMELEKEAELCEEQYKREAPIQMLLRKVAQGSKTMGKKGLSERSFRYHTSAYFVLKGYGGDAVWSNHEYWMRKGEGDHAEDAICDLIEILAQLGVNLRGRRLHIFLSSSPCRRCQDRLNKIYKCYGLNIQVTCADRYHGTKCGGAGDDKSRRYPQKILDGEEARKLIQF